MFNPQYFKVGDGWLGDEPNYYPDAASCWAAQAGIALGDIVMLCKGDFGTNYEIAGAHPYHTFIYTYGIQYNGTLATRSLLATTKNYKVTASNVVITHVKITNNNNYRFCVDINGTGSYAQYCYLEDNATGTYGAASLYGSDEGAVYNCDIKTTSSKIIKIGYDKPATVVSCTAFGATGYAIVNTPNSANQTTLNNFFFGNASDFGTRPLTFSGNASQDLTGNVAGYDESHCVDFAGGDYRIKIGSPLHGVSGAFSEELAFSHNAEINANLPPLVVNGIVDFSNAQMASSVSCALPSIALSSNASFSLPLYSGNVTASLSFLNASASVQYDVVNYSADTTALLPVISAESNAEHSLPVYSSNFSVKLPFLGVNASVNYGVVGYSADTTAILPAINISTNSINTLPVFNALTDILLPGLTANITYHTPNILPGCSIILIERSVVIVLEDLNQSIILH